MKTLAKEDFDFSVEKIVDAITTWANFNGFSGESCSKCKKTVNVLGCGPGWFCVCGHYNAQSFSHNQIPHDNPDLGPTKDTIYEAVAKSKQ